MWDPQWETFTQAHRVLRYDMRGFGRSPYEPGTFSHGRDLVGLLEQHGLAPASLVGVSMGGRVALEATVARPDLVDALVLVGSGFPGHDWSEEMQAAWQEEEDAYNRGDLDAAVEVVLQTWVAGPRRSPEDVDPKVRARVAEMQRRAYELELQLDGEADEEMLVPDLADRLGEIGVPTLVVTGEEDVPDIQAISAMLGREIPGARTASIAGVAHVPSMERPEEFDALVLEFLDLVR
jgi:pimeloyl-ACP methyl ester carboxylesterase